MKTVLVVEDERQIAQIAKDYLQHAGYVVITTGDGLEALALARDQGPDLIVLDLGLPRLDGMEVARRLRRESDVPIIMLTARVEESDRLTASTSGPILNTGVAPDGQHERFVASRSQLWLGS
jgi:DNA-binding response OmpR family regulator